jgi:FkbM family methyltransferase
MIDYSSPIFIELRILGQKLGILRPAVRLVRKLFNLSYEDGFDKQMMNLISANEVVWDIGANVGYFTTKFSEKVGNIGRVIAFEPTPNTYNTLVTNCSLFENITCHNIALSNKSGKFHFRDSGIENDPTNGLTVDTFGAIEVTVVTGDEIVATQIVPIPTSIKIDVEGYEIDVIQGMRNVLKNPLLKKLFIEVHFLEMNNRGITNGATEIVKIVSDSGFAVKWTDPSHFIALRN